MRAPALTFPPSEAFHRRFFTASLTWRPLGCALRPRLQPASRPAQLPFRWLTAGTDAARYSTLNFQPLLDARPHRRAPARTGLSVPTPNATQVSLCFHSFSFSFGMNDILFLL